MDIGYLIVQRKSFEISIDIPSSKYPYRQIPLDLPTTRHFQAHEKMAMSPRAKIAKPADSSTSWSAFGRKCRKENNKKNLNCSWFRSWSSVLARKIYQLVLSVSLKAERPVSIRQQPVAGITAAYRSCREATAGFGKKMLADAGWRSNANLKA